MTSMIFWRAIRPWVAADRDTRQECMEGGERIIVRSIEIVFPARRGREGGSAHGGKTN